MKARKPFAFVSYNQADKETATTVALFLVAEGIDVWFDEWRISAGDSIIGKVEDALSKCTHFIIVWSTNARKSNWVQMELKSALNAAIQEKSMIVVPLLIDDARLPPLLRDIRYIRYRGGTEQDRREIVNVVSGKQPSINLIKAIVKKYNEVVYKEDYNGEDPFGHISACPTCGATDFKYSSATDYARDERYYFISCKECGWMADSQ